MQCYGTEASSFTKKMPTGREGVLTYKENERIDKYGRTRLDIDGNGKFDLFNLVLVEQGYAKIYTQIPFELKGEFVAVENQAKRDKLGLWSACLNYTE